MNNIKTTMAAIALAMAIPQQSNAQGFLKKIAKKAKSEITKATGKSKKQEKPTCNALKSGYELSDDYNKWYDKTQAEAAATSSIETDIDVFRYRIFRDNDKYAILTATSDAIWQKPDSVDVPAFVKFEGRTYPVREIGESAFSSSKLISIRLPKGITRIGARAFSNSTRLKTVYMPEGIKFIGYSAFAGTGLTRIKIPESVSTIENGAFANTQLSEITFPKSLKTLQAETLRDNKKLKRVVFPENITSIPESTCLDCPALTTVVWPSRLKSIGATAFNNTGLATIKFPATLTSIGEMAFYGLNNLKTLTLPVSVTELGDLAFGECKNLSHVTIGEQFHSLEKLAMAFNVQTNQPKLFDINDPYNLKHFTFVKQ